MSEQHKIDELFLNSFIYNENLNKFDNNNYINGNNSITLLSLTDKIYEDEDHFNKGIIRKRNSKFENNCSKKEKSSSKFVGNNNKRSNRKSLFISNNKIINREFSKKDISIKKKRVSDAIEKRNKSNLNLFDKLKQRKSSAMLDKENEKSNNYTSIDEKVNKICKEKATIEENNKKSKLKKLQNKLIEDEHNKSLESCQVNYLKNRNKTVKAIKVNKKKKLSLGELDNKEREEKSTSKKTNNIKFDDKKKNKSNNIQVHNNKKRNEEKKLITCLFCCLNS
jgi:hypothetical protein